jgi:hypothetical protein
MLSLAAQLPPAAAVGAFDIVPDDAQLASSATPAAPIKV